MYRDLALLAPVLPDPLNYYLALQRLSVFFHLSSSCVKGDTDKDLVSLCHS